MNPIHQHAPTPEELRLAAVEQALIDSEAREIETKNQFAALLSSFRQLELLMWEMNPTNTPKTPRLIPFPSSLPQLENPLLQHSLLSMTETDWKGSPSPLPAKPTCIYAQIRFLKNRPRSPGLCLTWNPAELQNGQNEFSIGKRRTPGIQNSWTGMNSEMNSERTSAQLTPTLRP